ncbi:MAG: hypothetical protein HY907_01520 [Deltaproteobacteria bacterium]|nr:hypothetical protein [Deltaproteobacteria bacterium]
MRLWLLVLGCWLAGCESSAREPGPCGILEPATGEVRVCGEGQSCLCGNVRDTGRCAISQPLCSGRYQFATGTMECLSPAQADRLIPSTPADHPACPSVEDADAEAEADAESDADASYDADAEADRGADEATPDVDAVDGDEGVEDSTTEDAADDGAGDGGAPVEIIVFAGEELRAGTPDRRTAARDIGFPVPRPFERIVLEYDLHTACPVLCDPLARVTTVRLDVDGGRTIELLRAVTPFGEDASWVEDLTYLAPVLQLRHRVSVFIDTTEGAYEVDLRFVFTPGTPPREVRSVTPLLDETAWTATSDPAEQIVTVPFGAAGAALIYRLTGHATGGTGCDETCARTATVTIDGVPRLEIAPWRDDCGDFVADNPLGDPAVVALARSGWCPADLVRTGVSDVSAWLASDDHFIDLTINDIDPATGSWRASMVLVIYR